MQPLLLAMKLEEISLIAVKISFIVNPGFVSGRLREIQEPDDFAFYASEKFTVCPTVSLHCDSIK